MLQMKLLPFNFKAEEEFYSEDGFGRFLARWYLSTKLHGITLPMITIFTLLYFLLASLIPTTEALCTLTAPQTHLSVSP